MSSVDELRRALTAAADPARASQMRRYMRDQFPFLGVTSTPRRTAARSFVRSFDTRPPAASIEVTEQLWQQPEREFAYVGSDLLARQAKRLDAEHIDALRFFITTKSWWDTVDALAALVVGPMVTRHPQLTAVMDEWIADDNVWVARTAILHQLKYGNATDTDRLFAYCAAQAGHCDFFIRKAIGWALRQYARTDPGSVRGFVADHHGDLSPLSIREATKHL
ncbi:MAG: DNA alkylation repair protein [Acidimicrobiia bacterium]